MNWLRWRLGRTSPHNYHKMLLLIVPAFLDCYILRFKQGSSIDWHTDPVSDAFTHHRLNIYIKRAKKGGRIMSKRIVLDGEKRGAIKLTLKHKLRFDYMRPDITEHAVEKVEEGSAYILSIGWICRKYAGPGPR